MGFPSSRSYHSFIGHPSGKPKALLTRYHSRDAINISPDTFVYAEVSGRALKLHRRNDDRVVLEFEPCTELQDKHRCYQANTQTIRDYLLVTVRSKTQTSPTTEIYV